MFYKNSIKVLISSLIKQMLAELDQITSILSNVCVILIITWMVIKYFQFKKYISYYIKMTQTAVDQIDQLLLDAVASVEPAELDDNTCTKLKEKIIQVVAGGKSRRYLGKLMTTKEIEQLDEEEIKKLYARYEAALGGLIANKFKKKTYVLCLFTSSTFYLSNFEL